MKKKITTLLIALGCSPLAAQGQSVHGVKGAALWFQAAPVTDSLLNEDYHFVDISDMGLTLHVGTGTTEYTQARNLINTFNFNPAIDISKPGSDLSTTFSHMGLQQATVIGVFAPKTSTQNTYVYQMGGTNGFSLYTGKIAYAGGSSDLSYHPNLTDTLCSDFGNADKTLPRIITYTRTLMPTHSLWNAQETKTFKLFKTFDGYCPEIIVFNRMLSLQERRKIESYLALKYGLTLLGSYYNSSGNLIWNAGNNAFHHRVTGIGNDGSLSQLMSTSSYVHWASAANRDYETFCNHDSYSLTSRNRLLTIGRERGNTIPPGKYMIWGDNGANLSWTSGTWHIMNRTWKMESSITNNTDTLSFEQEGLTVAGIKHKYSVTGSGNGKNVIIGPASSGDKYFEFTCPTSSTPTFQIGLFERDSTVVCKYGYQFANGLAKRIVNGVVQSSNLNDSNNNCKGKTVRIYRHGAWMSLCIGNGFVEGSVINVPINDPMIRPTLVTDSPIRGDEAESRDVVVGGGLIDPFEPYPYLIGPQQYKGIISTVSDGLLNINNLRIGGFSDTGNLIELGYNTIANNSGPFNDAPSDTYLLINNTPAFTGSNVTYIKCDEIDTSRAKSIFHNVKIDPTEAHYFTFANGTPPTSSAKETFDLKEEATTIEAEGSSVFGITSDGNNSREFTAWLDLPGNNMASLLIFDAAGRHYGEYSLNGSGRRTATFSVNAPGVYIVKALTDNQEYTKKITVK
ncbi:MAG: T9SS type A sorting domain-containing protein [Prevotella sp.]|nr:T9SS type A sorting domain-containing protein [Prevotella sp.]